MTKIILTGWRDGFEKVSLTKLQMELLNISLKESKKNVDSLLNGEEIILEIGDDSISKDFLEKANEIGVNCKILR